jgi:hypothetical protein
MMVGMTSSLVTPTAEIAEKGNDPSARRYEGECLTLVAEAETETGTSVRGPLDEHDCDQTPASALREFLMSVVRVIGTASEVISNSIQWLMRFKPAWFRHELLTLLDLLKQGKIKPLIAQRLPLEEARRAHEMLGEGGVLGKIVLLPNG